MKPLAISAMVFTGLSLSGFAHAEALRFTGLELSNAATVRIKVQDGDWKSVRAGRLRFDTSSGPLLTYCADAIRPLNSAVHNYTTTTILATGMDGYARAARILGQNFDTARTVKQQAALQLAVWSALYDNKPVFKANGENFRVSNVSDSILNLSASYYAAGNTPMPSHLFARLYSSTAPGAQSQITVVPEPATMAALGLGVAALLRRRRK